MDAAISGKGSPVLVTGGSGFLGSHLCRRLWELGSEVHCTSRIRRVGENPGVKWWQCDWTDLAASKKIFREINPDVIYHFAGVVTATPTLDLVLPAFHSLLQTTVNLLTIATEEGCRRIVLAGSLREPRPSGLNWEPVPASPYEAAKWAGSGYGRMFHALYGTPVVILRSYMTYGPGQAINKLIPSIILSMLERESPKLSSGQWEADWIYVDDVIEGLICGGWMPNVEGSTIDLGSGILTSVRGIVDRLGSMINSEAKPLFGALPDRPFEQVRLADTASALAKIGWKATTSLERGLQQTVDWYREQQSVMMRDKMGGADSVT